MAVNKTWMKPFARAGYGSRGIVYCIIGLFAVLAAVGSQKTQGTKGALQKVLEQPFGTALLWLMVAGLIGYVIWRLIQSLLDTDDHGWDPKGLGVRIGLLASAFTYTTLAIYAGSILIGSGGSSGGGGRNPVTEFIATYVGNRWVSLILAVIFAIVAGAHIYKAVTRKYADHFDTDAAPMNIVHPISITGLIARGMVFVVITILLLYRFWSADTESGEAPGLQDALSFIQGLPFGGILLAFMGVGLLAFGAYSLAEARWRRINVEDA